MSSTSNLSSPEEGGGGGLDTVDAKAYAIKNRNLSLDFIISHIPKPGNINDVIIMFDYSG